MSHQTSQRRDKLINWDIITVGSVIGLQQLSSCYHLEHTSSAELAMINITLWRIVCCATQTVKSQMKPACVRKNNQLKSRAVCDNVASLSCTFFYGFLGPHPSGLNNVASAKQYSFVCSFISSPPFYSDTLSLLCTLCSIEMGSTSLWKKHFATFTFVYVVQENY